MLADGVAVAEKGRLCTLMCTNGYNLPAFSGVVAEKGRLCMPM